MRTSTWVKRIKGSISFASSDLTHQFKKRQNNGRVTEGKYKEDKFLSSTIVMASATKTVVRTPEVKE